MSLKTPELKPYKSILIRRGLRPEETFVSIEPRTSVGYGVSEAPRGILWHSYTFDQSRKILTADIVPQTSQNQTVMALTLWEYIKRASTKHVRNND